jgi:hypothetical protein
MDHVEIFENYDMLGFKVIPLIYGDKKPFWVNWNYGYNPDKSRKYFSKNNYNFGLLLGDIVDVEADSDSANERLSTLIGDYSHPIYKSKKSFHHLFKSHDNKLTRKVIQGIEFRGKLHQSVLPPSVVKGVKYRWVDMVYPIPEMPESLRSFYWKFSGCEKKEGDWSDYKCALCKKNFVIKNIVLRKEINYFNLIKIRWQCRECRKSLES